jgi:hypothetical protein
MSSGGRALRLTPPKIPSKVQRQLVENYAHESWICELPIRTQKSLDAQNIIGRAIDAWNSRDYHQAVESLGRK